MPPSRRNELIDAAMRVFYEHGFHSTGLDMVLTEGHISRMTLYNHFKSKDDLIVAALQRRDGVIRSAMMQHVESQPADPIKRLYAIFDWQERWFSDKKFHGCMFINVSAEFSDPASPIRRVAAEHKQAVLRYITERCEIANLKRPRELAAHLHLLLEGAIVNAHVVYSSGHAGANPADAAKQAKQAAKVLVEAARKKT